MFLDFREPRHTKFAAGEAGALQDSAGDAREDWPGDPRYAIRGRPRPLPHVERASASVKFLAPGTVVLQASVSDGTTTVTENKTITVNPACTTPSVTTQPTNQSITYGANATFTADANGTPAPSVQWHGLGSDLDPLEGETNKTSTLNKPPVADSGKQYRAVFTNTCNGTKTATSDPATLTVEKATVTLNNLTHIYDGTAKSASATTSNPSGLTVEITYDGSTTAPTNAGTYAVVGTIKEANYKGSASDNLTINRAAGSVSITNIPNNAVFGGSFTPNVSAAGDGQTSVSSLTSATCSVNPGVVSFVGAGTCKLQASVAQGTNHEAATGAQQSFNIGYKFVGFAAPVDNDNYLNVLKAGQAIPLKWRLLDANNNPVTNLQSATITVKSLSCATGSTDLLEEVAAGGSGLQNLGDGYYQYNWKSPTSYANSCRTLQLDLGEGTPRTANFRFNK